MPSKTWLVPHPTPSSNYATLQFSRSRCNFVFLFYLISKWMTADENARCRPLAKPGLAGGCEVGQVRKPEAARQLDQTSQSTDCYRDWRDFLVRFQGGLLVQWGCRSLGPLTFVVSQKNSPSARISTHILFIGSRIFILVVYMYI